MDILCIKLHYDSRILSALEEKTGCKAGGREFSRVLRERIISSFPADTVRVSSHDEFARLCAFLLSGDKCSCCMSTAFRGEDARLLRSEAQRLNTNISTAVKCAIASIVFDSGTNEYSLSKLADDLMVNSKSGIVYQSGMYLPVGLTDRLKQYFADYGISYRMMLYLMLYIRRNFPSGCECSSENFSDESSRRLVVFTCPQDFYRTIGAEHYAPAALRSFIISNAVSFLEAAHA